MNEIKFKRDTAFRKQFFVPDSFAHPAKMDAQLLIWITENYTQVGEIILDPMAGSGTTMLACGLGRNCVLVELEGKFCKMMRDNWNEVRMRPQLGYSMGDCQIIQGDARNLEGILADKIITSPPHGNRLSDPTIMDGDPQRMSYRQALADKIITSPPYEGIERRDRSKEDWWDEEREKKFSGGSAKIAKGYQIDKIVTSPPYEEAMGEKHHSPAHKRISQDKHWDTTYTERGAEGNIGNLKSQSYLQAMLQVYQQCHKVLKPQGLMILVTKNFIRNKQVVRLDTDTIKLCEQAGFSFLERRYRKLPVQSFWRVIYHRKHPEVEQINHEDILVFASVTSSPPL